MNDTPRFQSSRPRKITFAEQIHILWRNDAQTSIDYYQLRCDCPCAVCVDELTGRKLLQDGNVNPLVYPKKSEYVGNYALRIYWSDDHDTGIYTFRSLLERYGSEPYPS